MKGCGASGATEPASARAPSPKIKNGVKAAAKTGTSQVKRKINGQWQNDYNAVLITYAPVNDPETAIGIVIESGDTGVELRAGRSRNLQPIFLRQRKRNGPSAGRQYLFCNNA